MANPRNPARRGHKHAAVDLLNDTLTAGDILYVNASGELALLPKGSNTEVLTLASGVPSWAAASGGDVVNDTTPQLGGNLDVNSNKIVSTSNGNIDIEPNGTGNVLLGNMTFDADQSIGAGQDNYVLTYDNTGGLISLEAASGGGGASETKVLTANFTKNTDATLADVSDLSGFSLDADSWYSIEGTLACYTNTVGDLSFGFDFTNAPQLQRGGLVGFTNTHDGGALGGGSINDISDMDVTSPTDYTTLHLMGTFKSNATTGGTVDFQFAQRAAANVDTRLYWGSWIRITKLS